MLGAASVIDFLRTVLGRYQSLPAIHPLHVNGERGLYIEAGLDRAGQPIAARLECFHFAGTTVRAIYDVVNPDKLRHASPGFSLG